MVYAASFSVLLPTADLLFCVGFVVGFFCFTFTLFLYRISLSFLSSELLYPGAKKCATAIGAVFFDTAYEGY